MKLSDFDYSLPTNLIAQQPPEERGASRLFVVLQDGSFKHRRFPEIVDWFQKGDLVVLNETKVTAFRLDGIKISSSIQIRCLFMSEIQGAENTFKVMAKPLRRLKSGTRIRFSSNLFGTVEKREEMTCLINLSVEGIDSTVSEQLKILAQPPLPPYIKRDFINNKSKNNDWQRYQTVYACKPGAIAAPTAGLHFTDEIIKSLINKGVSVVKVNLQVGPGTFKPVRTDDITKHKMEKEYFEIRLDDWEKIQKHEKAGGRIFVVGTTVMRALESVLQKSDNKPQLNGWTELFIYPGYRFSLKYHALITNFHLPKSTLLMLVSAFAGKKRMMNVYQEAINKAYRFYSYGDATLLFSPTNGNGSI